MATIVGLKDRYSVLCDPKGSNTQLHQDSPYFTPVLDTCSVELGCAVTGSAAEDLAELGDSDYFTCAKKLCACSGWDDEQVCILILRDFTDVLQVCSTAYHGDADTVRLVVLKIIGTAVAPNC